MDPWIGPAIIAAGVSGVVSALGWFVTGWQSLRLEQRRRDEKVHDFQVALLAEIKSELAHLRAVDRALVLGSVEGQFAGDIGYVPFIPRLAGSPVFEALVKEIQILPAASIDPVIRYARFRQTVEKFVEDLRDEGYAGLAADRRLAMYRDYIDMLGALEGWATRARQALVGSLGLPVTDDTEDSLAVAPPIPDSGEGPASASTV